MFSQYFYKFIQKLNQKKSIQTKLPLCKSYLKEMEENVATAAT